MIEPESNVRVRGEVEHRVAARHGGAELLEVEDICPDEAERIRTVSLGEKPLLPGGKVVVPDNFMPVGEQPINHTTTNETGRAGDECFHVD
jgi:hypothetical protein